MLNLFRDIVKYADLSSDEFLSLTNYFEKYNVPKKTTFIEYGDRIDYLYFIESGLMHINAYGGDEENRITAFIAENEWVNNSLYDFEPYNSMFSVTTIENTDMWRIKIADFKLILEKIPQLHFYFGKCLDYRIYKLSLGKVNQLIHRSADKYTMFLDAYERLINRLPLHLIASYLNMKPETLSRSRKSLLKR